MMKSQINPKSFTFPINQKPMLSTISPVSFSLSVNQKMMLSTINPKVMTPFLQMKESGMRACNPNMDRDNIRYESPKYVKLTKKAVIPASDIVLNQSSPNYNRFEWD